MTPPIILSRRELYDLVWSKPMRDVAAEFGISDVGLSKVCERHCVPRPEQGHWNKINAGKKVKQTLFVETDDPTVNRVEIRGGLSQVPEVARQIIEKARAARKTSGQRRDQFAQAPKVEAVVEPHRVISRTAKALRKGPPDRNGGVRAFGEGLCGVAVAADRVERAISFLDGLARTLEQNGLILVARGQAMGVTSGADEAVFTLKERTRQEKHSPTGEELAEEERRRKKLEKTHGSVSPWLLSLDRAYPEFDTIYTGEFAFQIEGYSDGVRRKWADGKTQTVERLLDDIVVGIIALLAARKQDREDREVRQRERKELERRRALASRRSDREEKRLTYIRSVFDLNDEAGRLRDWLDREEIKNAGDAGDDFDRLVAWARARLSTLEATTDPHNLDEDLKSKKLFPETDELVDPLGEPPDETSYW